MGKKQNKTFFDYRSIWPRTAVLQSWVGRIIAFPHCTKVQTQGAARGENTSDSNGAVKHANLFRAGPMGYWQEVVSLHPVVNDLKYTPPECGLGRKKKRVKCHPWNEKRLLCLKLSVKARGRGIRARRPLTRSKHFWYPHRRSLWKEQAFVSLPLLTTVSLSVGFHFCSQAEHGQLRSAS